MNKAIATALLISAASIAAAQNSDINSGSRVGSTGTSYGQSNNTNPNSNANGLQRSSIFNKNASTSGKATPTPAGGKPGATPAPATRAGAASTTMKSTRATSSTTAAKPAGGPASRGGGQGAASSTAQSTGQIKEVTKAFLEAIRTQKVDYDEQEMAESPGVLILNSRKYKPEKSKLERESGGHRASSPIAQPL